MKISKKKSKIKTIIIIILIIAASVTGYYSYISNKSKDMSYVIERYTTKGIFNKHKLFSIDNYFLAFSDGKLAVVEVTGLSDKQPRTTVKYKLFLEKNEKGIWKVKRFYPNP